MAVCVQFLMGTLKLNSLNLFLQRLALFQFLIGTLKTSAQSKVAGQLQFQFLMVHKA